jgi:protein AbiQ
MKKRTILTFLSNHFYDRHPHNLYPELGQKRDRPHVQVCVEINEISLALPLRSNINHPHVFWTDKENRCGIDYTKAIVITDNQYYDSTRVPYLRPKEFKALRRKKYEIGQGMKCYVRKYKKAKANIHIPENRRLVEFSTLQYYEEYLTRLV